MHLPVIAAFEIIRRLAVRPVAVQRQSIAVDTDFTAAAGDAGPDCGQPGLRHPAGGHDIGNLSGDILLVCFPPTPCRHRIGRRMRVRGGDHNMLRRHRQCRRDRRADGLNRRSMHRQPVQDDDHGGFFPLLQHQRDGIEVVVDFMRDAFRMGIAAQSDAMSEIRRGNHRRSESDFKSLHLAFAPSYDCQWRKVSAASTRAPNQTTLLKLTSVINITKKTEKVKG
ncbi:hypothetical protein SDC9_180336 [bioreactor metagenome]|uniref:Uncharacterized protein n=1 Tax=bioreactor metagenome TaxID=1076179 RepID=A0A645HAM9_9ZZZZ